MLIVLAGLPGVGKTTVARAVAAELGAVHLRIDTIEQALTTALGPQVWDQHPDAGYRVAYALAGDLLRAGHTVVADSVNPILATRASWRAVAAEAGSPLLDVEVVCSDPDEHRSRVGGRDSDIPGLALPTWEQVLARPYEPLAEAPGVVRVDTAGGGDAVGVVVRAARSVGSAAKGEGSSG